MSLWTPSGEHPVGRDQPEERPKGAAGDRVEGPPKQPSASGARQRAGASTRDHDQSEPAAAEPDIDTVRRQLAEAPAAVVVANHCYGLFELAAVHLSGAPPHLADARLAIDALGFLVDGLGERLGEAHASLRDALAQIRLAYVQIAAAQERSPGNGAGSS